MVRALTITDENLTVKELVEQLQEALEPAAQDLFETKKIKLVPVSLSIGFIEENHDVLIHKSMYSVLLDDYEADAREIKKYDVVAHKVTDEKLEFENIEACNEEEARAKATIQLGIIGLDGNWVFIVKQKADGVI